MLRSHVKKTNCVERTSDQRERLPKWIGRGERLAGEQRRARLPPQRSPRPEGGHLCSMLDQTKLHVDRAVENLSQRLGSWRLFGVGAMLRVHDRGLLSV